MSRKRENTKKVTKVGDQMSEVEVDIMKDKKSEYSKKSKLKVEDNASDIKNKKKKSKKKIAFVGCLVLIVLVFCCISGVILYGIFTNWLDKPTPDVPSKENVYKIDIGTKETSIIETINSQAGTIVVDNASDDLDGLKIEYADGAVDDNEEITVSHASANSVVLPEGVRLVGDVLVLEKTGDLMFNKPVAITLPYDKSEVKYGEMMAVYVYYPDTQEIVATTLLDRDKDAGTLKFLTTHFTNFIVLELEKTWEELDGMKYDIGFTPVMDGWFIENWGSYISDGGNCLGMSSIAQYVYSKQSIFGTDFYEALREGDKDDQLDDIVANELAARAQFGLANRWNTLAQDLDRFSDIDQPKPSSFYGQAILTNLMITREPQILYVQTVWKEQKADGSWVWKDANQHAVLAYKYEDGKFAIYDPNHPYRKGKTDWEQSVSYSWKNGFGTYDPGFGGYNYIRHIGPSLITNRPFISGLVAKAKNGFPDDNFPDIEFTSPEAGVVLDKNQKSVVVTGTVSGGNYNAEAGEKFLHWYYQNEKGGLDHIRGIVEEDGTFSQELPVVSGSNTINALLAGKKPTDEWAGYKSLTFDAMLKPADMIITLTWANGRSDIDLHVTDPEGNHVWYMNRLAPTGANLDFDNTVGYGPEHYTISSAEGDRMPEGNYKVEVVYYYDGAVEYDSIQAIPWTVSMRWVKMIMPGTNEKIWESVTRSGTLTSVGQKSSVYTIEYSLPSEAEFEVVANPFGK